MDKAVFLVVALCTDAQRDVVRQHYLTILAIVYVK